MYGRAGHWRPGPRDQNFSDLSTDNQPVRQSVTSENGFQASTIRNARDLGELQDCTAKSTAISALERGTRLRPNEILAPLGAGGMGEVYRTRDTRLDRIVAIKFVNEQFSNRFEREARAVAALNHLHVCQLYDVGPNCFVMEYIDGQPLKGPLLLCQALEYAAQICGALDAADRSAIIRCGLKPAKVLVTASGVKLLDFGFARVAAALEPGEELTQSVDLTQVGTVLGTAAHRAAEQVEAKPADSRSDHFALGTVLYEMLTGSAHFRAIPAWRLWLRFCIRSPARLDPACLWKCGTSSRAICARRQPTASNPPENSGRLWN